MSAARLRGLHLALLVLSMSPWIALILVTCGALPELLGTCVYRAATGVPCPLCGGSRALLALLSGEPAAALALNPLGPGLLGLAVTQPPYRVLRTVKPIWSWREEMVLLGAGLAWLAGVLLLARTL